MERDVPSPMHSELDAFQDLSDRTEDPNLPPLQRPSLATTGRKRTIEEALNPSSDIPMFSSDDLSASLETYSSQNKKRQHIRRWWDDRRTSLSTEAALAPTKTKRSAFSRNDDSGVWMNSDDAEPEMDEVSSNQQAALQGQAIPMSSQETEDLDMVGDNSESIIPPYWQRQPENLVNFHAAQARASELIQTALDCAAEAVDLMSLSLDIMQSSTLRPLHLLTRVPAEPIVPMDVQFHPLIPKLGLFLRNNTLCALPGEIYKLSNLRTLSAQHNLIQELSPSIRNLDNLRELNLSVNQLRYLPYEILNLCKGRLTGLRIRSNPFVEPLPRNWNANTEVFSDEAFMKWLHADGPTLRARSTIAYFDAFGKVCRASCLAPSKTEEYLNPLETPWSPYTIESLAKHKHTSNRAPSLTELCLRACQGSTFLSDFATSHSNEEGIPESIIPLLQEAWTTQDAGKKQCSVCDKPYIIARTEWLEWWSHFLTYETMPKPFLRRGCSWACVPDHDEALPEEWRDCGWGYSRHMGRDGSSIARPPGSSDDHVQANIPGVWPAVAREMRLNQAARNQRIG